MIMQDILQKVGPVCGPKRNMEFPLKTWRLSIFLSLQELIFRSSSIVRRRKCAQTVPLGPGSALSVSDHFLAMSLQSLAKSMSVHTVPWQMWDNGKGVYYGEC